MKQYTKLGNLCGISAFMSLSLFFIQTTTFSEDAPLQKSQNVDIVAKATSKKTDKTTDDVVAFIQKYKSGYFATVENNKPRVRPWGLLSHGDGKLYFATSNTKAVYDQLQKNPYAEWVCSDPNFNETVRILGRVVFIDTKEIKQKTLEKEPRLKKMYGGKDGEAFEMFYLTIEEVNWLATSSRNKKN